MRLVILPQALASVPAGWSAGRRSGSVAELRMLQDHRPRRPRDGSRKPVRAGLANPLRQGSPGSPEL